MLDYLAQSNDWLIPGALVFLVLAGLAWMNPKRVSSIFQHPRLPATSEELPPVYTAKDVQVGRRHVYLIKCTETGRVQHFHVQEICGDWFRVRVDDFDNVAEGWATEIPSDQFLHRRHLRIRPSHEAPNA